MTKRRELIEAACGALAGAAVGDALGGADRGLDPGGDPGAARRLGDRHRRPCYDDWRDARPIAPYHKGDGHITDDTLMTHALVEVYAERRAHLDAYAIAEQLVPRC